MVRKFCAISRVSFVAEVSPGAYAVRKSVNSLSSDLLRGSPKFGYNNTSLKRKSLEACRFADERCSPLFTNTMLLNCSEFFSAVGTITFAELVLDCFASAS